LILAGRGFGKTRAGSEWIIEKAKEGKFPHLGLIGETAADVRDVMVEGGDSSIIKVSPPWFMPAYQPSKRRLVWPNGVTATTYSGDEPDQLRGPQHYYVWADEPAKWKYPQDAWDNMEFGLRSGRTPQVCATTTPRPIPLLINLIKDPQTVVSTGSTYENVSNLSESFLKFVLTKYEGTRIGRQELYAEILGDVEGALWSYELIEATRVKSAPTDGFKRILVGLDPSGSGEESADEAGVVAVGLGYDGHAYVIGDYSLQGSPNEWATVAINTLKRLKADRIVAEVNFGGDMVKAVLESLWDKVPFKKVHASRGKTARAEPVSALFEQGKCHLIGLHPKLEDEMCHWVPGEKRNGKLWSPGRMDAMVWAVSELMITSGRKFMAMTRSGEERDI
jgi:phage terminase large subunit-like protein